MLWWQAEQTTRVLRPRECHREDGARNTTHTACSGPLQNTTNARTIKVRYNGHKGETIRAAQKPWGSYEAVDTGLVSWGIAILMPVLPLGAAVGAGVFTVREFRRAGQPAASEGAA